MRKLFIVFLLSICTGPVLSAADFSVTVVDRPDADHTNAFYVGNRAPLVPSQFLPLPTGCVQPAGWLRVVLERERDGLCGRLDEVSEWLQQDDNAWLNPEGKGGHGWEEVPYWLRGYGELAWVLGDPAMIVKSEVWIKGVLNSQRANGDFGPATQLDNGNRDFWPNMLMLFCLETYYEGTGDSRVIDLMTRYFHYQMGLSDAELLGSSWGQVRAGDELAGIYWLYNRTGEEDLLALAKRVHGQTSNWEMPGDLPSWHNVNIAEGFREPATYYLQTHDTADLAATYADFNEVRRRFGQVPGGMFGGDENCRPGFADPHQAVETCGMVEQMFSDEMLVQISGDPLWADNCEDVAFNSLPAALTADQRALRYLTAPNLVVSDARSHSPGLQNGGPMLLLSPYNSRCCLHNYGMGWPYFTKHLWLATPDNGLCADIYSPSRVAARVGNGTLVRWEEKTHYPFAGKIDFTLRTPKPVQFPLYLRLPGWCEHGTVSVNGQKVASIAAQDRYVRIIREWRNGDGVRLELPMRVSAQRWSANRNSVSLNYGPLTFSLKIGERVARVDGTGKPIPAANAKNGDQALWPSYCYYPATPWNYGLLLNGQPLEKAVTVKERPWPKDDFPFTPEGSPLQLRVKGKQVPAWKLDSAGLCAVLPSSPVASDQPAEKVTLIPMGAARLRISAFPTIAE